MSEPSSGRKPGQNQKLTKVQRARRDERILTMRAANVPWRTIAAHHDITERAAQMVVAAWRKKNPAAAIRTSDIDPDAYLEDFLAGLRVAKEQFFVLGMTADQDAARIGALKNYVETSLVLDERLRVAGILPSNPAAPQITAQVMLLFREVGELMRQRGIPDDVLQDLDSLVQARMGRPSDDGRALPPAA